jgi:hypothetical protein
MLKRIYSGTYNLGSLDLAPQAVVNVSVAKLRYVYGINFEEGTDDLDDFKVAYYTLDDQVVALMHHTGEPASAVSVYLDRGLRPGRVQKMVAKMTKGLGIDQTLVGWIETHVLRGANN